MHAAAYALDPEFLYSGDGGALDEPTMDGLLLVVERLALRSVISGALNTSDAIRQLTTDSEQVQEVASTCMQQFARFRSQVGVLTKPLVIANARTLPPSQWWLTYGSSMPELQAVACAVLKQPASACAAERNWSVYGSIKGAARSSLQHQRGDKRVYCHEALHYQHKLQHAMYQQDVEEWGKSDDEDEDEELDVYAKLLM